MESLRLERLRGLEALAYTGLTFPAFRPRLRRLEEKRFVAVAALWNQEPAGLLLLEHLHPVSATEISSLVVREDLRRRGIGGRLLEWAELAGRDAGLPRLIACFSAPEEEGEASPFAKLLMRGGWPKPVRRGFLLELDPNVIDAPWARRYTRRRRGGLEVFPWSELREEERRQIEEGTREGGWIPAELSPFAVDRAPDSTTSFGMRAGGLLVGWALCDRVGRDSIRITRSWARPEYRRRVTFLHAENQVLDAARKQGITRAIFGVNEDYGPMQHFTLTRLRPYIRNVRISWEAEKRI